MDKFLLDLFYEMGPRFHHRTEAGTTIITISEHEWPLYAQFNSLGMVMKQPEHRHIQLVSVNTSDRMRFTGTKFVYDKVNHYFLKEHR